MKVPMWFNVFRFMFLGSAIISLEDRCLFAFEASVDGPGIEYCNSNTTKYCEVVMQDLIGEDNPIKPYCGNCNSQGTICQDEGLRGVFPADITINWILKNPVNAGGGQTGKKSFTEQTEVECGRVKECTGCEMIAGSYKCKSEDRRDWLVKPRRISGDECMYALDE